MPSDVASPGSLLGALFEPLDYPRRALWHGIRGAAEGDFERMWPALLGLGAFGAGTLAGNPWGGAALGNLVGGAGYAVGHEADPERFTANPQLTGDPMIDQALALTIGDPMMMTGIAGAARGLPRVGVRIGQGFERATQPVGEYLSRRWQGLPDEVLSNPLAGRAVNPVTDDLLRSAQQAVLGRSPEALPLAEQLRDAIRIAREQGAIGRAGSMEELLGTVPEELVSATKFAAGRQTPELPALTEALRGYGGALQRKPVPLAESMPIPGIRRPRPAPDIYNIQPTAEELAAIQREAAIAQPVPVAQAMPNVPPAESAMNAAWPIRRSPGQILPDEEAAALLRRPAATGETPARLPFAEAERIATTAPQDLRAMLADDVAAGARMPEVSAPAATAPVQTVETTVVAAPAKAARKRQPGVKKAMPGATVEMPAELAGKSFDEAQDYIRQAILGETPPSPELMGFVTKTKGAISPGNITDILEQLRIPLTRENLAYKNIMSDIMDAIALKHRAPPAASAAKTAAAQAKEVDLAEAALEAFRAKEQADPYLAGIQAAPAAKKPVPVVIKTLNWEPEVQKMFAGVETPMQFENAMLNASSLFKDKPVVIKNKIADWIRNKLRSIWNPGRSADAEIIRNLEDTIEALGISGKGRHAGFLG